MCIYANRYLSLQREITHPHTHTDNYTHTHTRKTNAAKHPWVLPHTTARVLITLRSHSAQPHKQNFQNLAISQQGCVRGRTTQVARVTRAAGARVWSCAGHHGWKPIAGPRAGGFGLLALLEFENTSEANICSWGTSWDVTHKHDLLRWLAGLGMGCLYIEDEYIINDTKPFNLHAEWMLQMTSQSNPWID